MSFRSFLLALIVFPANVVLAQSVPAKQDPCVTLDGIGGLLIGSDRNYPSCYNREGTRLIVSTRELEIRIATETLSELRRLIKEVESLRADMSAYNAAFAQAKSGFEVARNTMISNQEAWRKSALDQTLEDVRRIPARLAEDDDLRKALISKLKEELPVDPAFVNAVRTAIQP